MDILPGYTAFIGRAGVFLALPRVRFVFSVSVKDVQLGGDGPPGGNVGEASRRAATRMLERCRAAMECTAADIANLFLPSDCRICGAALAALGSFKVRVCEACIAGLRQRAEAAQDVLCTRCGDAMGMESARFAAAMGVSECTMCRLAPPEFERAVASADYDNEMRELLHLLKFDGRRGVAKHVLGEGLASAVRQLRGFAADELVVVPVPLFAARERSRGFNQATVLAEAAMKRLRRLEPEWSLIVNTSVLSRIKDTRALFALNPSQRRLSLRGAFRVADAEAIRDREVLLIDDILTTGATARECARVLKRAGAAKIWVATAAKAQPESVRSVVQHEPESFAMWDMGSAPAHVVEPNASRQSTF